MTIDTKFFTKIALITACIIMRVLTQLDLLTHFLIKEIRR